MEGCKSVSTPVCQKVKLFKDDEAKVDESHYRSLIGCLMYLTTTRSDILYAINFLSRFMNCANETHFKVAKRVLRYIKRTLSFGIKFCSSHDFELQGYADSDWAVSLDDLKNTSGFYFYFGSGIFTWSSKKQEIMAQSTTVKELIATTSAVNHALWIKLIMCDLHLEQKLSTKLKVDNQDAITISNNIIFHRKIKHFSIKLFFRRDVQKDGAVRLKYCKTED